MAEKNQKLVLTILEFLEKSIADGSVREDDKEGIEVASKSCVSLVMHQHLGDASLSHVYRRSRFSKDGRVEPQLTLLSILMYISTVQCIGEAFGVNPSDEAQRQKLSIKPATLQSLFDVYLKTKEKISTPQVFIFSPRIHVSLLSLCETPGSSSGAPTATTRAPSNKSVPSAADKSQAEQLKAKGNALMTSKDYNGAIAAYTSAIALDPTNAVYYSNRAAAHSSSNNHDGAVKDAEKAIEVDSSFVKAYHRLGSATETGFSLPQ